MLIAMGLPARKKRSFGLWPHPGARGRVVADNFMTVRRGVFAAGDMHIGQSLVVRAINEGQHAASACHAYLSGAIEALSSPDCSKWRLERCACIQIMRATLANCRFAP